MSSSTEQSATLAGGCFWCLEAVFQRVNGITSVVNGYTGGHVANPTYKQVCSDTTGHAEAVELTFDPLIIAYRDILEIFFVIHDPTTLNRQGHDIGHSYRSAIFFQSPDQEKDSRQFVHALDSSAIWPNPIVTEIVPLNEFYPAEAYHQNYYLNNPTQPYCVFIIEPKIRKFLGDQNARPKSSSPPT